MAFYYTTKIKDYKEVEEGAPVKVRPVCGAVEAPCGQLSNLLSEVISSLTLFENSHKLECRSSEEMRAAVKEVNSRGLDVQQGGVAEEPHPAWRQEGQRVVGSTDFKSYYPRLPVARAARVVRDMVEESEVTIKTNNTELALFLASTMGGGGRWSIVERSGLGEVVHTRLHTAGATPGITSREKETKILLRIYGCKIDNICL